MAAITEDVLNRWFSTVFQEQAPQALEPLRQVLLATPPCHIHIAGSGHSAASVG